MKNTSKGMDRCRERGRDKILLLFFERKKICKTYEHVKKYMDIFHHHEIISWESSTDFILGEGFDLAFTFLSWLIAWSFFLRFSFLKALRSSSNFALASWISQTSSVSCSDSEKVLSSDLDDGLGWVVFAAQQVLHNVHRHLAAPEFKHPFGLAHGTGP